MKGSSCLNSLSLNLFLTFFVKSFSIYGRCQRITSSPERSHKWFPLPSKKGQFTCWVEEHTTGINPHRTQGTTTNTYTLCN
ncbi:hypothetical protein VNO78_18607 [Psophocarpus tetragonolobus]|uniref:Secreted protein n=1 Tax=Psophocarpus tetragonolobus TaxID=3891 RepID=A0AAN9SL75_PSOTE